MSITVLPLKDMIQCIGQEKKSGWVEISQERINQFADCTDDHQFIHVDIEKSKEGPFGTTIAHGFLTLSLLTSLSSENTWMPEGVTAAINYGFNKVRFIDPVPSGAKIQDTMLLSDVVEKSNGRVLVTITHTIDVEGKDKPALVAEWLMMYFT